MDIGQLNTKVSIMKPALVDNGLTKKPVYTHSRYIWVNLKYVSDGEKYRAGSISSKLDCRITFRNSSAFTLSVKDQVKIGSKTYNVSGVKLSDDERFVEATMDSIS